MGHISAAQKGQAEDVLVAEQALSPRQQAQHRQGAALLALLKEQMPSLPVALAEDQNAAPRIATTPPLIETLLLPGRVTELCAEVGQGAFSLALSLLHTALSAQPRRYLLALPDAPLCAYALRQLSLPLAKMLLVHAPVEDRLRLCVRSIKSGVFAGLVLDLRGFDLSRVLIGLRRIALAAEEHNTCVFLLTEKKAPRALPLPVAVRADVTRHEALEMELSITVQRHMLGRFAPLSFTLPEPTVVPAYNVPIEASPRGKRKVRGRATRARGHRGRKQAQMALQESA